MGCFSSVPVCRDKYVYFCGIQVAQCGIDVMYLWSTYQYTHQSWFSYFDFISKIWVINKFFFYFENNFTVKINEHYIYHLSLKSWIWEINVEDVKIIGSGCGVHCNAVLICPIITVLIKWGITMFWWHSCLGTCPSQHHFILNSFVWVLRHSFNVSVIHTNKKRLSLEIFFSVSAQS